MHLYLHSSSNHASFNKKFIIGIITILNMQYSCITDSNYLQALLSNLVALFYPQAQLKRRGSVSALWPVA
jgi:hypothetical protein